ncbi:MAG: DEAD/DEAH box helicase [Rhodoferax sp.]|nr:DEAD/DEAH box helicase [Rhodoferax sp.]
MELYRNQKVLDLHIQPVQDYWQLRGNVQGTERQPYQVEIELKRSFNGQVLAWDSQCSCPVGDQCKHGVALLIKAAYRGFGILQEAGISVATPALTAEEIAAQRQAETERLRAIEAVEAEKTVQLWLSDLDRASHPTVEPDAVSATHWRNSPAPTKREYFLYLVSVNNKYGQKDYPQLNLEVVSCYQKTNGDWAKAKVMKFQPERGQAIFDLATEADRDVLQLMRAMPGSTQYSYYGYNSRHKVVLEGKFGVLALQIAASTERMFIGDAQSQPIAALTWGPPQTLNWLWHEVTPANSGASGWVPRPKFEHAGVHLCLNTPALYLDTRQGVCGQVDLQGLAVGQAAVMLRAPALRAEALKKYQPELITRLGPVPLPPILEPLITLKDITPKACLHLQAVSSEQVHQWGLMLARLSFDYDGYRGWWAGQGSTVLVERAHGRAMLQRDPQAELEAIMALREQGFTSDGRDLYGLRGETAQLRWLQLADCDYAPLREAGFEITLDTELQGLVRRADRLQVSLSSQGEDDVTSPWFDLSLGMEIEGERHNILPLLPALIAGTANSPRDVNTGLPQLPPFVYLPNPGGGFVRLPTDNLQPWLGALLELVGDRAHDFSASSLKLSRFDALRTTASLGDGAVWNGTQHLSDIVRRLQGRAELPEVTLPASVIADLRPYQQQGVNWLQFLRECSLSGILADDMGLGKTLQTLVHIQIEKDAGRLNHPVLIVAPVSLMGNWRREAARFCPQLRCLVLHGSDRHGVADSISDHDVVITPYSLLHRDRERWLPVKWHLLVLDEAQNIKNANTNAAQLVGELQAAHRLCLSGTPMENNLGELWSLFHFLMPGFLGSQKRFNELFRKPIEKQGDPEATQQLRARVTPFMLRRTKALVAHELPPKVESVMPVELVGKQADLYETIRLGMEKTVREALSTRGLAKSQITILDALLKLRQVCCDPRLLKLQAAGKVKTSAKLERLMEMLPEMLAEGRRILLFSQFTSMLTLIEAELKQRNIRWVKLTGQSQNRDQLIEQFTGATVPLFLISLKAGGVGLNLPQADTVIHYDPWWNPAVENQATDRAHRIGQTQSVWVVKLVAQGTIEERILALQERKAALAESMYSGSVGRKQPLFSESDLVELLKPLSS